MTCRSCHRAAWWTHLLRRGRHRAHRCDREVVGRSAVVACGCSCNAISSNFQPPMMAIFEPA